MTRKLNNKQIVQEAMDSAKRSMRENLPLPPKNADGSFKSVNQLVDEERLREWKKRKADKALIAKMDARTAHDPEQVRWERSARQASHDEYETVIPDGVKAVFYLILFIVCVAVLISAS